MTRYPRTLVALLTACSALAVPRAGAQKVSSTEQAIAAAVDTHNADALALLKQIVNTNSGTMNFAGVRQVADALRPQLDALGFTTHWVDGSSFNRAGHLVAEHAGPGPKLLLIGHLDTVFPVGSKFQQWTQLDDSTATGPGIIDMKGGDVMIIYALRALKDAGQLDRMNVTIVYDGDEENAGAPLSAARKTLIDAAAGANVAIGFEDGAGDPATAVVSRRGAGSWTLTTTGNAGHSSQIFRSDIGAGAVFEASRILTAFYTQLRGEQYLTFNPGLALGGTTVAPDSNAAAGRAAGEHNVVAEHMVVEGDIRTLSPAQLATTKQTMRDIVSRHLPQTNATIVFDDGYPPMAPTAGNRKLLAVYDQASRDLGFGAVKAVDPSRAGAADVAFIADRVPMIIDGVGLSGHDDHSEKETAYLNWLPRLTKRAAITLYRLSQ